MAKERAIPIMNSDPDTSDTELNLIKEVPQKTTQRVKSKDAPPKKRKQEPTTQKNAEEKEKEKEKDKEKEIPKKTLPNDKFCVFIETLSKGEVTKALRDQKNEKEYTEGAAKWFKAHQKSIDTNDHAALIFKSGWKSESTLDTAKCQIMAVLKSPTYRSLGITDSVLLNINNQLLKFKHRLMKNHEVVPKTKPSQQNKENTHPSASTTHPDCVSPPSSITPQGAIEVSIVSLQDTIASLNEANASLREANTSLREANASLDQENTFLKDKLHALEQQFKNMHEAFEDNAAVFGQNEGVQVVVRAFTRHVARMEGLFKTTHVIASGNKVDGVLEATHVVHSEETPLIETPIM